MSIWQIMVMVGFLCLILEMCLPSMFFLNFAVGAFITAVCAIYISNWTSLTIIFAVTSLVSLIFLRPLLVKKSSTTQETGINAKYIGKRAKVVEDITPNSGVISIYDERWDARAESEIPAGQEVIIESNDSLIMHVKEIK